MVKGKAEMPLTSSKAVIDRIKEPENANQSRLYGWLRLMKLLAMAWIGSKPAKGVNQHETL